MNEFTVVVGDADLKVLFEDEASISWAHSTNASVVITRLFKLYAGRPFGAAGQAYVMLQRVSIDEWSTNEADRQVAAMFDVWNDADAIREAIRRHDASVEDARVAARMADKLFEEGRK